MPRFAARLLAMTLIGTSSAAGQVAAGPKDEAISALVRAHVGPGEPGCTVGVVQDGALTHALAFGLADLERQRPLDSHSVFNLASVSKQFTVFALLLLEQDGKLGLDDPLVQHVPELAASARGVTLRHLVHHTGGLRDYIEILTLRGRGTADGATIQETIELLARQTAPNEAPGVEYDYSNTGYFLLGVVIARASGMTLAEFSRRRIFEPLGMRNTSIVDQYPAAIPKLARGYAPAERGFRLDETGWEQVGDGQVHSDLHDLALWDGNFYSARVGGRALLDRMLEVGQLNSGASTGYAGGVNVYDWRGLTWVTHGGSWVGYRSSIRRVPSERFSAIVLCNRAEIDAGVLSREVSELFLADRLGPPEPEDDDAEPAAVAAQWAPKDLARYAGAYFSREAEARCVIDLRDGRLLLETCATGSALRPGKPGEFVTEDGWLTLKFAGEHAPADSFQYWSRGLRGLAFERVQEGNP